MRILIIGKTLCAATFANYFASNENNIVFTTLENTNANFIDFEYDNIDELKDFALANQIDFSLLCDYALINSDFAGVFTENNLTVLSPDLESARITLSRGFGKRFMYKNKIKTPKFGIFDKPQTAIDYARSSQFPLIIQADYIEDACPATYCATFPKAKIAIEKLFEMNAKQIVIENAIEGTTFSLYVISDGYNAYDLDYITTYKNKIALTGVNFMTEILHNEIMKRVVEPTISSLSRSKKHYIGILAFDFIADYNKKIYLTGYRPFFNDLDACLFAAQFKDTEAKMFNGAITGSLTDDIEDIEQIDMNFISVKNDKNEIVTTYGRTANEAKERAFEETNDKDIFKIP